ncbi:MAG TPA: hypothetical protein VHV31_08865 [Nitrolancea sp.]|nr:hypothetical protein [Nitrolancea sp.]
MIALRKVGDAAVTDIVGVRSGEAAGLTTGVTPRACATIRVIDANDPGSVLADVEPGMIVIGSALDRLGTVASVFTADNGVPVAIVVAYGLRGRKQKYVPGEFVDLVDDNRVILSFDHHQFKSLRDIGD